jgi:hypothetical protein
LLQHIHPFISTEAAKKPSQKKLEEVEDVTSIFGSKPAKRSSTTTSNNKEPSPKKTRTKASDTKEDHHVVKNI